MVRSRTLPQEDLTGQFLVCAMGIFIEALAIAAAPLRLELQSEAIELDYSRALIPFARLYLAPRERAQKDLDPALLLSRRTSRLPPDQHPIPAPVVEEFREVAAASGQHLSHIDDPQTIRHILDRNVEAVFHDLNVESYHEEIIRWFRYTQRQAAKTGDGLDARCMNTPAHELLLSAKFPALMRWRATKPLLRALYHRRLGGAPCLGMLAGPFFESRSDAERAGRGLLRLWLTMAGHNVSIHPFGNLVTNPEAHRWLTDHTGVERIWLVFRMGYTATPPRSLRLPTEDILCSPCSTV